VTFGCFNTLPKINDSVITLWSRILHRVANSHLYLKNRQFSESALRDTMLARFAAHGISSERLLLEGASPRQDYFKSYHRVDIALDPFPFTGGTTSIDGVWMGVPFVTRKGDRMLTRQGESILRNLGLDDWIATDDDAYVNILVTHATDLPQLAQLRRQLRARLLSSPLCDAPRFTRNMELAFRSMWQQYTQSS
jgi:predicted O-linked N-acetylglucosamine transferase (SPINDLY family)